MKIRKSGVIFFILLGIVCTFLFQTPLTKADNVQTTTDGLKILCDYYTKTAKVTGYSGEPSAVTIPAEFDGCSVVSIGSEAFEKASSIETVFIPNTVKIIGSEAFLGCEHLKTVTFAEDCDIETLAESAFSGCTMLSELSLPVNGFVNIGDHAFSGCTSISEFTFASRTKTIGESTFYGCSNLSTIIFNEGLETVGKSAFEYTDMTSITLPSTVTSIGETAFAFCKKLETANNLPSLGERAFYNCVALKNVTIGEGAKIIEEEAFYGTALQSVIIPSTVTCVEKNVFCNCELLSIVYVLGKDISINATAFTNNSKISLYGYAGSGTETCAKGSGLNFVALEGAVATYAVDDNYHTKISWNSVTNATQYSIYRSDRENGEYTLLATMGADVMSYTDENVERGKSYYYYLTSKVTINENLIIDIQGAIEKVDIEPFALVASGEIILVDDTTKVIQVDTSAKITIEFLAEGTVDFEVADPSIVSAKWCSEFKKNKAKVKLVGLKKGSTTITFTNSYNADAITIYINVIKAKVTVDQVQLKSWKRKPLKKNTNSVTYVLNWKKVSGATGYEIMFSIREQTDKWIYCDWYTVIKKTKKLKVSRTFSEKSYLKGLNGKVRAYKVVDGKKYYGKWSSVKKAKIR